MWPLHILPKQTRTRYLVCFVLPSDISSFLLSAKPVVWRPARGSGDGSSDGPFRHHLFQGDAQDECSCRSSDLEASCPTILCPLGLSHLSASSGLVPNQSRDAEEQVAQVGRMQGCYPTSNSFLCRSNVSVATDIFGNGLWLISQGGFLVVRFLCLVGFCCLVLFCFSLDDSEGAVAGLSLLWTNSFLSPLASPVTVLFWCVVVFRGGWPTPCVRITPFASNPSCIPLPAQPWAPGFWICRSLRDVSLRLCPLPPSLHASHKSLVLLVRALPNLLSFYLFFQEIIWAGTIRLVPYSSSQHPRQSSSFKLLLGRDNSEPLKMARQVGCCNNHSVFALQTFYSCFVLPLSAQVIWMGTILSFCNVRHRAPQLQPKPCGWYRGAENN